METIRVMEQLLEEIKKTNILMEDMAKDMKDTKTFLQVLTNKLSGM